jgi:hypothetical protein
MSQDIAYDRAKAVILSCKTKEQLSNANKYMLQYVRTSKNKEHAEELRRLYLKRDGELFPK